MPQMPEIPDWLTVAIAVGMFVTVLIVAVVVNW